MLPLIVGGLLAAGYAYGKKKEGDKKEIDQTTESVRLLVTELLTILILNDNARGKLLAVLRAGSMVRAYAILFEINDTYDFKFDDKSPSSEWVRAATNIAITGGDEDILIANLCAKLRLETI